MKSKAYRHAFYDDFHGNWLCHDGAGTCWKNNFGGGMAVSYSLFYFGNKDGEENLCSRGKL